MVGSLGWRDMKMKFRLSASDLVIIVDSELFRQPVYGDLLKERFSILSVDKMDMN